MISLRLCCYCSAPVFRMACIQATAGVTPASAAYLSVCLSARLSICLFVRRPICLCFCLLLSRKLKKTKERGEASCTALPQCVSRKQASTQDEGNRCPTNTHSCDCTEYLLLLFGEGSRPTKSEVQPSQAQIRQDRQATNKMTVHVHVREQTLLAVSNIPC